MSNQLISTYYNALHRFKQYGGSQNESSLEHAFINLVNSYAEKHHLLLVPKISVEGKKGNKIIPDGVLKNALRLEFGYWESKDTFDDLDKEIHKKLNEDGYPDRNILFEDTKTAVLFQEGAEVMRVSMEDADRLDEILNHFISFEPLQVREFNKALEQFKKDVPEIVKNLRELIEKQAEKDEAFREKRNRFHELAQHEINPEITLEDVREMLIQHILTEDIFDNVFGNASFHRFNNIARELEDVLNTFMDYSVRQNHLQSIRSYYDAIRNASSQLADHHEKQNFLKQIYENFYKVYNPKGADRLGVVYTPNEIVRFMIESADWLLEKHFGKSLGSKGVEILDPATGTGTFIAELIEYINPHELQYKYLNEIHANEVAILPYYIANLNIEYTYQQKMNEYKMFSNICFVDTLDNIDALDYRYKQLHMFGISSENAKRIQEQNKRKISVIIGNPPYRANQRNFNDFNANREYKEIDERIKDTFVKVSTAQKNKSYDMYSRFYRWSMDRIDKNGIICFVSNNSFIDADSHDGFRKCAEKDFNEIWLINLKGDARTRGERRKKEGGNIFNDKIREGIAIYFLIKNEEKDNCRIHYYEIKDYAKAFEKIDFLRSNKFTDLTFERIVPDKDNNWLNLPEDNDYNTLLALADERNKVFDFNFIGLSTNRDEWVYDFSKQNLADKMNFFIKEFNKSITKNVENQDVPIKWSSSLVTLKKNRIKLIYDENKIIDTHFRPFVKKHFYSEKQVNDRLTRNHLETFGYNLNKINYVISWNRNDKEIFCLASKYLSDLHFTGDSQCFALYQYDAKGYKHENITDWALKEFQNHYSNKSEPPAVAGGSSISGEKNPSATADGSDKRRGGQITKEDIFYYTYAVLHAPVYRKKYEQNLKREFPRLPFYDNFFQWRDWGKELMDLHINYETQEPYLLERIDEDLSYKKKKKQSDFFSDLEETEDKVFTVKPRTKLRVDKMFSIIEIDTQTSLLDIPEIAWEYKLGNRSALEWILDQYKERKPKDATIAERFNTYKFEDYKEQVIDLLKRVCNVSVKTMEIINQMPKE